MRLRARHVLVIANPAAGLKRGRPGGEEAARGARRAGAMVELYRTTGPSDAERAAAAAPASGFDLVLAAGGDGTAHEVANGISGSGLAMGVAPCGTMNLLARVLGVPLDPALAGEILVGGSFRLRVRPGRAGGRLFLLMAGAGFDSWVLRELLRGVSGKIRFSDYVRGAARGLATFPFPRLEVQTDGGTLAAHSVIVGRAPLYGGFLRPTPGARLGEGPLELLALAGGRARLAALLPRMWSGAHASAAGATLVPVRRVAIAADRGDVPYQLDGELAGTLPVAIDLSDSALSLATPSPR